MALIGFLAGMSIILGLLLFTGWAKVEVLPAHIVLGFVIAVLLAVLAIIVLVKKKAMGLGIAGLAGAILLPIIGLLQLPRSAPMSARPVQYVHIFFALACFVMAEMLADKLRE